MNQPRWPSRILPVAACLMAAWSLAPLAIVWDNADPDYFAGAWQTWLWGSAVAALAVALVWALSRGRAPQLLPAAWRRVMALPPTVFVGAAAAALAGLAVLFAVCVFDGNPRNVDGFAQLFQARMFLAGRPWMEAPRFVQHFGTLQMIFGPDRWYSQYPPGQSLVLAAGLMMGAWWLINPLLAVVFVAATWRVARWCTDESTARLTLVLLCLSPFVLAVSGSEMSHLAAATLAMLAAAAAVEATERQPIRYAVLAGLVLGVLTAFRPLDAVAAAVPVGVVLLWWAPRRGAALAAVVLAGIVGTIPTLWYNAATTGSWHLFGYTVLWGKQHSLGFHPVPFGIPLTFTRAVARSGLDLHQINTYLMDATVPALVVVALGFVAGARRLMTRDALPFVGVAALVGLLFFYWHRDVFYGPRFLFTAIAWFVMLLARGLVLLRRSTVARPGTTDFGLVGTFAVVISIVVGLVSITPGRIEAYRLGTPTFNYHPARDAARAGIHNAVVFIPDGWGSRLIARLWQQHVPVRASSRLYAAIDACTLEQAVAAVETLEVDRRGSLMVTLDSLAALHRPGVPARLTADANLRLRADVPPAPECLREIEVDRRGFLSYGPYLWLNNATLDGDVVWARDLGPRNALFVLYPGRRFYRYVPGPTNGAPLFLPVDGPSW